MSTHEIWNDQRMTSSAMLTRIKAKFPYPEYAVLSEVRNAPGFRANRSIDAVAIGLWPSRGIELIGFEIKIGRSDWLREKNAPEKADAVVGFCDRWYVVVSDVDIVRPGELPPTWGLMVASGRGLGIKTEAPKLDAKPLTRGLLACLMKRAADGMIHQSEISGRIDAALKEGLKATETIESKRIKKLEADLKLAEDELEEFRRDFSVDKWGRSQWRSEHAARFKAYCELATRHGALEYHITECCERAVSVQKVCDQLLGRFPKPAAAEASA